VNRARAFQAILLAGVLGAAGAFAQEEKPLTQGDLLKRMETIGAGTPKKPLGLEGTPLAEKKGAKAPKKAKGQTEITAKQATFDQKTREAVFIADVEVKDPEFNVKCDRLIAFMKKEKNGSDKPAANPPPAAEPPDKKDAGGGGGLDHAIAEANPGKVVTITQDKLESDGSITRNVGNGRKATYDATTGDVVLTGMPSVQQGINLCVALEESTVMTLNRDGHMRVEGAHKTTIKDSANLDGGK
jgi:lipopolysaccharide export system protein LptA